MENASKALIMAAAILLGIMILSTFVYMYTQVTSNNKSAEEVKEAQQLEEFNKQYESYYKKSMYGTDVITIINKAIDNNVKNQGQTSAYIVDVEVTLVEDVVGTDITTGTKRLLDTDKKLYNLVHLEPNSESFLSFKRRYFKCTNISYENGRVNKISFKETPITPL